MQPPDQPQQSMQPPLTPPHGGLHVPLPDSPMQDSIPGSPGPPQDPPPPSPPPAGVPVQAPGSPLIHWYVAPGTPPWMPQAAVSQGQPPPPSPPPRAPIIAQQWMLATCLSRTTSSGRGNFSLRGNLIFRGNDAFDYNTFSGTATTANAARAITGFSGGTNFGQRRRGGYSRGPANASAAVAASSSTSS